MSKSRIPTLFLVGIIIFFGLHFMRVFLASVIWYLEASLAPEILAFFALGIFALALILPISNSKMPGFLKPAHQTTSPS